MLHRCIASRSDSRLARSLCCHWSLVSCCLLWLLVFVPGIRESCVVRLPQSLTFLLGLVRKGHWLACNQMGSRNGHAQSSDVRTFYRLYRSVHCVSALRCQDKKYTVSPSVVLSSHCDISPVTQQAILNGSQGVLRGLHLLWILVLRLSSTYSFSIS